MTETKNTEKNTGNGNLIPWKKGECGNPNGRPKKEFSMTEAFKEVLSEKDPTTKIERYRIIINKAVSMATRGDTDMIKYIINRLEGMPQGSAPQVAVQVNNYQLTEEDKENWAIKYLEGNGWKVSK